MKGHTITETLNDLKIKRSTYYAWSKQKDNKKAKVKDQNLPQKKSRLSRRQRKNTPISATDRYRAYCRTEDFIYHIVQSTII